MPGNIPEHASHLLAQILGRGHELRFAAFGRSMVPYLSSGDRVIIRRVPFSSLLRGDLVLCRLEGGGVVLHRLLRVRYAKRSGPVLCTKGDALDIPDPPAKVSEYLGKAVAIEGIDGRTRRLDHSEARFTNFLRALYHSGRSVLVRAYVRSKQCRFRPQKLSGTIHRVWINVTSAAEARQNEAKKRSLRDLNGHFEPNHVNAASASAVVHPPPDKDLTPALRRATDPRRLLYGIINGRQLPDSGFTGWPAVAAAAESERVQGLLYNRLQEGTAPDMIRNALRSAYHATIAGNVFRIAAVERIDRAMADAGVSAMLIKGALLVHQYYKDPGLRPMEDIDLLVRPGQAGQVATALQGAGFLPDGRFPALWRGHGIVLDLHRQLLHADRISGRTNLFPIDPWRDAAPLGPGFSALVKPDPADHFLFLAHHLIKHSFARLIWLVDLRVLLESADRNFRRSLWNKAARHGQERPLAYALYLLDTMLGYRPSDFPGKQPLSPIERRILDLKVRGRQIGDLGHILWLFCLPDYRSRGRFLAGLLFPAKHAGMTVSFGGNRLRRIRERLSRSLGAARDIR